MPDDRELGADPSKPQRGAPVWLFGCLIGPLVLFSVGMFVMAVTRG